MKSPDRTEGGLPPDAVSTLVWAGAAVVDITPQGSVFLFGYPHVPRFSTGVHDPLECAALFVRGGSGDGAVGALFLASDLIFLTKDIVADVRRRIHAATGVAEAAILVSATHTHSGPITADYVSNAADPAVPKCDPSYVQWAADRMVDAGTAAVKAAEPAEIGLAIAKASGVGSNRHDPAGATDPDVPVLVARSLATRQPLGCMVVYGMHPTVLHEDSKLISADFPCFTRRWLRQSGLPASCPVIYHNGASGNQSPRHMTRANTFAEAQRLGELLGRAIAEALPTIAFRREAEVRFGQRFLELEPRVFPSMEDASKAVERTRLRFEELKRANAPRQAVRTAECDVFGAEETAELARAAVDGRLTAAVHACLPAEIQVIVLGPWKFAAWPGEFFVEYGLALRARAENVFLVTIANGELQGYVVTEDAVAKGVYESTNAVFSHRNGPQFVEATLALIGELSESHDQGVATKGPGAGNQDISNPRFATNPDPQTRKPSE